MKCKKCGETLDWLILLAIMIDCGAKVHPSPLKCSSGGEHDFILHILDDTIEEKK